MAVIRPNRLPRNDPRRAFNTEGVQRAEEATGQGLSRFRTQRSAPVRPTPPPVEAPPEKGRNIFHGLSTLTGPLLSAEASGPLGWAASQVPRIFESIGESRRTGQYVPPEASPLMKSIESIDTPISEHLGLRIPEMSGPVDELGNFILEEGTRPSTIGLALMQVKAASALGRAQSRLGRIAEAQAKKLARNKKIADEAKAAGNAATHETFARAAVRNSNNLKSLVKTQAARAQLGATHARRVGAGFGKNLLEPIRPAQGAGVAGRFGAELSLAVGARAGFEKARESDWWEANPYPRGVLVIGGMLVGGTAGYQLAKPVLRRFSGGVKDFMDAEKMLKEGQAALFERNAGNVPTVLDATPIAKASTDPHVPFSIAHRDINELLGQTDLNQERIAKEIDSYIRDAASADVLNSMTKELERDKVLWKMPNGRYKAFSYGEMPIRKGSGNNNAEAIFAEDVQRRARGAAVANIEGLAIAKLLDTEIDAPDLYAQLHDIASARPQLGATIGDEIRPDPLYGQAAMTQFEGPLGSVSQQATWGRGEPKGASRLATRSHSGSEFISLNREELPEEMWHVTTNWSALDRAGKVDFTGAGLRRSIGAEHTGLGGDPINSVSLTGNEAIADHLEREFKNLIAVTNVKSAEEFYDLMKEIIRADAAESTVGAHADELGKSKLWEYIIKIMHNPDSSLKGQWGNKSLTREAENFDLVRGLTFQDLSEISRRARYDGSIKGRSRIIVNDPELQAMVEPRPDSIDPSKDGEELLDEFVRLVYPNPRKTDADLTLSIDADLDPRMGRYGGIAEGETELLQERLARGEIDQMEYDDELAALLDDIGSDPKLSPEWLMRDRYQQYLANRQQLGRREANRALSGRSRLRDKKFTPAGLPSPEEIRLWHEDRGVRYINPNFIGDDDATWLDIEAWRAARPSNVRKVKINKNQIPDPRGVPLRSGDEFDRESLAWEKYERGWDDLAPNEKAVIEAELPPRGEVAFEPEEILIQRQNDVAEELYAKKWDDLTDEQKTEVRKDPRTKARLADQEYVDDVFGDVDPATGEMVFKNESSYGWQTGMGRRFQDRDVMFEREINNNDILEEIKVYSTIPIRGTIDPETGAFIGNTRRVRLRDIIQENGQLNPILKRLGLLMLHTEGPKQGQYSWSAQAQPWENAIKKIQAELNSIRKAEQAWQIGLKDITGEDFQDIPEGVVFEMAERWNRVGIDGRDAPEMPFFGDVVERTDGINMYFPRYVVGGVNAKKSNGMNSLYEGRAVAEKMADDARKTGYTDGGHEYQLQMFENVDNYTEFQGKFNPQSNNFEMVGSGGLEYLGDVEQVIALRIKAGINRINAQWERNQLLSQMAGMGGMTLTERISKVPAFAGVRRNLLNADKTYKETVHALQDLPSYRQVRREMMKDMRERVAGLPADAEKSAIEALDPLVAVERSIATRLSADIKQLVSALKEIPQPKGRKKRWVKNVYDLERIDRQLTALAGGPNWAKGPTEFNKLIQVSEEAAQAYRDGWKTFESQLRDRPTLRRQLEERTGRSTDRTEEQFMDSMNAREVTDGEARLTALEKQIMNMDQYYARLGIKVDEGDQAFLRDVLERMIAESRTDLQKAKDDYSRVKAMAATPADAVQVEVPYSSTGITLPTGRTIPSTASGEIGTIKRWPDSNRFWDAEFADRYNQLTGTDFRDALEKTGAYRTYVAANNAGRVLNASVDLAAFGINGLYLTTTDPVTMGRVMTRLIDSMTGNPQAWTSYLEDNEEYIWEFIKHGGFWGADNDVGEFLFPNKFTKVFNLELGGTKVMEIDGKPYEYGQKRNEKVLAGRELPDVVGLGQTINLSNIAFGRTGNSVRLEMFKRLYENEKFLSRLKNLGRGKLTLTEDQMKAASKGLPPLKGRREGISDKEMKEIVTGINQMTGYSEGGVASELLGPVFFAPRYFMAQMKNLMRAATNGGVAGGQARDYLLRTGATVAALTELTNRSQGIETDWNPVIVKDDGSVIPNPAFMKAYIGDYTFSYLGPLDNLMRSLMLIALNPTEGLEWLGTSKSAPVPSMLMEAIVHKRTFAGEPVDLFAFVGSKSWATGINEAALGVANMAQGRLPFTVGNVVQDVRDGVDVTKPSRIGATLAGFLGARVHPSSPYVRLNHAAQRMFSMDYDELNSDDKVRVREANPLVVEELEAFQDKMAQHEDPKETVKYTSQVNLRTINRRWYDFQSDLMQGLADGAIGLSDLSREYSDKNGKRIAESAGNTDMMNYGDDSAADENRRLINAYYNTLEIADSLIGANKWDDIESMQRELVRNASPEAREYLEYFLKDEFLAHPESIRPWLREGQVLSDSAYYDLQGLMFSSHVLGSTGQLFTTTWSNVLGYPITSYQDAMQALRVESNTDVKMRLESDIKEVNKAVTQARHRYRDENPRIDAAGAIYRGWKLRPSNISTTGEPTMAEMIVQSFMDKSINYRYTPSPDILR